MGEIREEEVTANTPDIREDSWRLSVKVEWSRDEEVTENTADLWEESWRTANVVV